MEQLNLFLHPEVSALEEVANLKTMLDKLRRSFFKRYELEMDAIKHIEERLGILENAKSDGKDRIQHSRQADSLVRASSH